MMQTGSNNRVGLGYFHLARGIGMVLILLGHSMTPFFRVRQIGETLFAGAGSVLGGGIMAMFFMISGFGFYSRSPRKCLRNQYKLLLKPYFLTAAAILATKALLAVVKQRSFAANGGSLVLTYLLGMNAEGGGAFLGVPVDSVSIMWFVLALFGGWIIYNGIARLDSSCLRLTLVTGCVVLGWGLTVISPVWPWCLPMMLLAVGYLAVGHAIKRGDWLTKKLPAWCWVLLCLVTLCCAAWGNVNMVACRWKLGLLDVAGSFCVGFLLLRGYCALMEREWKGRLISFLESVGLYSVWIVFLHGYEKVIFPWYRLRNFLPEYPLLCTGLCLLLRCGVIYFMMRLIMWLRRSRKRKHSKTVIIT